ncbi:MULTISPECIES: hypothetical protein [Bacillus cereus group]|uniref:Group-specific protein n=1 Tax=Bacillus wiedmannii TaxID=1890302 RepID=A0ABD6TNT9_9BACI|nr:MULTISPECIES: hypothetical protein [Bacillus cereus group]KAA0789679.1 hypothetical protein DN394_13985 [Bacillus sp. BB081]PEO62507.1 hypothetical protein CN560_00100 [Bacillus wiedmannii]PEP71087.1 hypothetical protein CN573_25240 [Bacillus wiedmannii]PGB94124.1 hypothetical protein COM04_19725 [Bacillus wiedmannii]PGC26664.1 hypothetical protein COM23_05280 [Bacillus wiedmannii]
MSKFRKKMVKYLQTFWGCLAFGVLMFAIFLIMDLTDTPLNSLGWRDWLGSAAGAAILSVGMFTLNKLDLK